MTVGRAALLGLMRRYLEAVMDPFVSLLEVHKLMYFMQEAGEDLSLRYQKATYGPYAENLRHVLSHIEGHFITGYGDAADHPEKQIQLNLAAAEQAEDFLLGHPLTCDRFTRVAQLIEGFETAFGMELLSTVHWSADMREPQIRNRPSRKLTHGDDESKCSLLTISAWPGMSCRRKDGCPSPARRNVTRRIPPGRSCNNSD
jgi:uncharacterized protein YwgA